MNRAPFINEREIFESQINGNDRRETIMSLYNKIIDFQKLSAAAIIMAAFMIVVIGLLLLLEDRFGRALEM